MDPLSALKSELIRPFTMLFIPGIWALAPFIVLCHEKHCRIADFAKESPLASSLAVIIAAIFAGILFEDIGSQIEWLLFEKIKKTNPQASAEWDEYLRLSTKDEIIGQRYLRTILLRMKFELSMLPSVIIFTIGINWANYHLGFLDRDGIQLATYLTIGCGIYLLYESAQSIQLMIDARKAVIDGVKLSLRSSAGRSSENGVKS